MTAMYVFYKNIDSRTAFLAGYASALSDNVLLRELPGVQQ